MPRLSQPAALLLAGCLASGPGNAQEAPRAADLVALVPGDALAVLDLVDAAALWERLHAFLLPLPKDLPPAPRLGLLAVGAGVKAATGLYPEELLRALVPAEAVLALLPRGALLVARDADAGAVQGLARHAGDRVHHDLSGGVLTVASSEAVLREALALRSGLGASLHARPELAARPQARPGELRLWVDLEAVRAQRGGKRLWDALDPGGRLLVGPVAQAIDRSTRLTLTLHADAEALVLEGALDGSVLGAPAALLLAAGGEALPLPAPPADVGLVLRLDRSLRAFFQHAEQLLPEAQVAQLRGGLSIADALLGRASLLDDVLAHVGEPATLWVLPRALDDCGALARPTLPSFVLVAPVESARAKGLLLRLAGAFALVANAERGRKRQPVFATRGERVDGEWQLVARCTDKGFAGPPPVEAQLSPSLRFAHGHLVLASTEDGAQRAAEALAQGGAALAGDLLRVHGPALGDWLVQNRGLLALDAVLKSGKTLVLAAQELDTAAAIARALEVLEVRIVPGTQTTALHAELRRRRP